MKKFLFTAIFLAVGFMLVPEAQAFEPWGFAIYNGTKEPADYAIPGANLGTKTGKAACRTVMGVVNWGDCSISAAMKDGNIKKVTSADWEKKFIVVYGVKSLRVYGN